jgi:hypothetical protein
VRTLLRYAFEVWAEETDQCKRPGGGSKSHVRSPENSVGLGQRERQRGIERQRGVER